MAYVIKTEFLAVLIDDIHVLPDHQLLTGGKLLSPTHSALTRQAVGSEGIIIVQIALKQKSNLAHWTV